MMGQREDDTGGAMGSPVACRKTERSDHHIPEVMSILKVWVNGSLDSHLVEFTHNCGMDESWVQEELPW